MRVASAAMASHVSPRLGMRSRCMTPSLKPVSSRKVSCVVGKNSAPRSERAELLVMRAQAGGQGMGMSPELKLSIDQFIGSNKVVVFMKGEKESPQVCHIVEEDVGVRTIHCGFSAKVVQVFTMMNSRFETVNILADERLRSGMKEYSQWPTFPQVYINGEFYGGADIVLESAQDGTLQEALEVAFAE